MRAVTWPAQRRWIGAGAGLALVAGVAVVAVGLGLPQTTGAAAEGRTASTSTASVERRTLVAQEEFSGTLGYEGELRVVNEIRTSGAEDVATLSQAVASAQAAYDNAVRTLAAIEDPTPENVAAARAQVRSAESNLLSARIAAKGATPAQLATAAAQLAQAKVALAAAQANAAGPTASQLATAEAQLAQAQAALVVAQNAASGPTAVQLAQAQAAVNQARISLNADLQALDAAQQAVDVCVVQPECAAAQQSLVQAQARVASDQENLRVAEAQLAGLTSSTVQAEAQAALAVAHAQVATAQAALDAMTGPAASDEADAQLAAAEATAQSAQAALDELSSTDSKAQRDAQVKSAQAGLTAAQAGLAAILNPTPAALADATSNVTVTKASLEAAKANVDQLRGTVTWLPAEGTVIERGDPLYELDGEPSGVLMYGERPAWRAMAGGIEGEDVRQLQENLIELGIGDALTASGVFDASTTAAVKAWQASIGHAETGAVELGVVVFQPGAVRVATHEAALGDTITAGTPVLTATSIKRIVTVDLPADDQDLITPGDAVEVELPDGTSTTGRVETVGSVATPAADGQGSPTIDVRIALDDPSATGTVDQAPVDVHITTLAREDVLAVPVNSLLALLEGGYAIEVVGADGTTSLVGVETGMFEDGWVEIDVPGGTVGQGDQVVVPS